MVGSAGRDARVRLLASTETHEGAATVPGDGGLLLAEACAARQSPARSRVSRFGLLGSSVMPSVVPHTASEPLADLSKGDSARANCSDRTAGELFGKLRREMGRMCDDLEADGTMLTRQSWDDPKKGDAAVRVPRPRLFPELWPLAATTPPIVGHELSVDCNSCLQEQRLTTAVSLVHNDHGSEGGEEGEGEAVNQPLHPGSVLLSSWAAGTPPPTPRSEDPEGGPHDPWMWGLRLSQLLAFHAEVHEDLELYCKAHGCVTLYSESQGMWIPELGHGHVVREDCGGWTGDHYGIRVVDEANIPPNSRMEPMAPNMHVVVQRYVKHKTLESRNSYALMVNPAGLRIGAFVTHAWSESFPDFVTTLKQALDEEEVLWICAFAMNQHSLGRRIANGTDTFKAAYWNEPELSACPFAMALARVEKLVVAVGDGVDVPRRAWCTYEIDLARQAGVPTFIWPSRICLNALEALLREVEAMDAKHASASDPTDQQRIKLSIMSASSEAKVGSVFEQFDRRLRDFLGDRVRLLKAMMRSDSTYQDLLVQLRQCDQPRSSSVDGDAEAQSMLAYGLEQERMQLLRRMHIEADQRATLQEGQRSLKLEKDLVRRAKLSAQIEERERACVRERRLYRQMEQLRIKSLHDVANAIGQRREWEHLQRHSSHIAHIDALELGHAARIARIVDLERSNVAQEEKIEDMVQKRSEREEEHTLLHAAHRTRIGELERECKRLADTHTRHHTAHAARITDLSRYILNAEVVDREERRELHEGLEQTRAELELAEIGRRHAELELEEPMFRQLSRMSTELGQLNLQAELHAEVPAESDERSKGVNIGFPRDAVGVVELRRQLVAAEGAYDFLASENANLQRSIESLRQEAVRPVNEGILQSELAAERADGELLLRRVEVLSAELGHRSSDVEHLRSASACREREVILLRRSLATKSDHAARLEGELESARQSNGLSLDEGDSLSISLEAGHVARVCGTPFVPPCIPPLELSRLRERAVW